MSHVVNWFEKHIFHLKNAVREYLESAYTIKTKYGTLQEIIAAIFCIQKQLKV